MRNLYHVIFYYIFEDDFWEASYLILGDEYIDVYKVRNNFSVFSFW